jgi:tripartite-type tricarboxylate transporter receptor subunit TctC
MHDPIRRALVTVVTATMTCVAVNAATAEDYPTRPISVIVPYGAGGQTDLAGRLIADALATQLGQTVTVVNKPGAGGVTGTAELAATAPNGYTIGLATSTPILQKPHISKTPYTYESFDYICRVNHNPLLFAVKKDSNINTVADLIKLGKSGTRITYGSSGEASVQHLAMTVLSERSGVKMVHVPNTADTNNLRNILAGVLTGTLVPASVVAANADTIKPIGLMDTQRLPNFPEVATFAEAGYDITAAVWGILVGPKGLDKPVLTKLRKACGDGQATDKFKSEIVKLGMQPAYLDGDAALELVAKETKDAIVALKQLGFAN